MSPIAVTARVGSDRRIVIDVPDEVPEGEYRVGIWLRPVEDDRPAPSADERPESYLKQEGNLLVYTGPMPDQYDVIESIQRHREERMWTIVFGDMEP